MKQEQNLILGSHFQITFLHLDVSPTDEALGQVDIWLDVRSGWPLVSYTPARDILWPSVILLQVRLICGHFGSGWPLVRCTPNRDMLWPIVILLQVRLTFGQTLGQVDIWLDVSPQTDILWPSVILLWVRLAFGHIFRSGWHLVKMRCNISFWSYDTIGIRITWHQQHHR